MYFYRCTEQQLNDALQRIHESGDTLLQAVYKGGRDWVLVCRKGDLGGGRAVEVTFDSGPFADAIRRQSEVLDKLSGRLQLISDAVVQGARDGNGRAR
jgi:hypothetical protein